MITQSELKALRIKHDLTQGQAAALVYTTEREWSRFENGDLSSSRARNNYKARTELFEFRVKELAK